MQTIPRSLRDSARRSTQSPAVTFNSGDQWAHERTTLREGENSLRSARSAKREDERREREPFAGSQHPSLWEMLFLSLSLSRLLHPFGSHVDHGWLATTKAQHPKREEREAGLREGLLLFSLPPVFPRRKRRGRKEGKRCSENLVRSLVFTLVRSPVLKSSPRLRVLRLSPSFPEGEKVGENQQPFHPTSLLTAEERQRATWNQRRRKRLETRRRECLHHLYKKPYQAAISQKEVQSDPRVSGPTSCS